MEDLLFTLGSYLAGEFENGQQALAEPTWYVHLRLWQRPVPLFEEDSLTFFAEQASIVNLSQPYRPRLLRLRRSPVPGQLEVQYYMFRNLEKIKGAGSSPERLKQITPEELEILPDCRLLVTTKKIAPTGYEFLAVDAQDSPCRFSYQGKNFTVALGFKVNSEELRIYDRGIDSQTGKPIWGALMGPFRFQKNLDFTSELPN